MRRDVLITKLNFNFLQLFDKIKSFDLELPVYAIYTVEGTCGMTREQWNWPGHMIFQGEWWRRVCVRCTVLSGAKRRNIST